MPTLNVEDFKYEGPCCPFFACGYEATVYAEMPELPKKYFGTQKIKCCSAHKDQIDYFHGNGSAYLNSAEEDPNG